MPMRNLTIQRTSLIIVFLLLFTLALRVPIDTDTWWHLSSGAYTLNNGMIQGDPFSHTFADTPWINHSWGAQILLLGIWQLAGDTGLVLYTAGLAVTGMALLYQISAGNVYLRAFVLILGATTATIFWSARPQMLSFFFSTVILWLVYRYKRDEQDWLWGIIPLMWLWSNLHAGWSIGYLFLIAFIVGEVFNNVLGIASYTLTWAGWRKLLIVTVLSIPLLALSPYGLDNLLVPFNTVNIDPLRAFIQEWQSPNFQGRETWAFIAMVMLLFMALWASELSFDWSGFFLLIGTLFLALLYARNIAVFAVVATPILTHHLDNALTTRNLILRHRRTVTRPIALLNLVLIVLVFLGVSAYAVSILLPDNVSEAQAQALPVDAAAYLNTHDLPRELFNSYNWGGYLIFSAPDYPVFVDGRTDLYGDFVTDYARLYFDQVDDLDVSLREYNINLILVEVSAPMVSALATSDEWALEYEDDLAMIWIRE
ncbi:MAG: hypothetical protein ACFE0Q_07355 [Anaerolineae bacterium]